jgi:hypothetical protein
VFLWVDRRTDKHEESSSRFFAILLTRLNIKDSCNKDLHMSVQLQKLPCVPASSSPPHPFRPHSPYSSHRKISSNQWSSTPSCLKNKLPYLMAAVLITLLQTIVLGSLITLELLIQSYVFQVTLVLT